LHESTRKLICRALILFCVFLPTTITLICTLWNQTPWSSAWRADRWERQVSEATGWSVSIDKAIALSPRQYQLTGIRWRHPETDSKIGSSDIAWLTQYEQGWVLRLQTIEVQVDQLADLTQWLHDRLLCKRPSQAFRLLVQIDQLSLLRAEQAESFKQLDLDWQADAQQSVALLTALPENVDAAEKVSLKAVRLHDASGPKTQWLFQSNGNPCGVGLLASIWPETARLGANASFVGDIRAERSKQNTVWSIDGSLEMISLDELTRLLPQGLAGTGRIGMLRATVRNQQLVQASGELSIAGGGSLHREWLISATQILGLRLREGLADSAATFVHFDQLNCQFDWDKDGLRIHGGLSGLSQDPRVANIQGLLAVDSLGPLFADSGVPEENLPRASSLQVIEWLTTSPSNANATLVQSHELANILGRFLPYPSPQPTSGSQELLQARQ
jgi:hypothetical protein